MLNLERIHYYGQLKTIKWKPDDILQEVGKMIVKLGFLYFNKNYSINYSSHPPGIGFNYYFLQNEVQI